MSEPASINGKLHKWLRAHSDSIDGQRIVAHVVRRNVALVQGARAKLKTMLLGVPAPRRSIWSSTADADLHASAIIRDATIWLHSGAVIDLLAIVIESLPPESREQVLQRIQEHLRDRSQDVLPCSPHCKKTRS